MRFPQSEINEVLFYIKAAGNDLRYKNEDAFWNFRSLSASKCFFFFFLHQYHYPPFFNAPFADSSNLTLRGKTSLFCAGITGSEAQKHAGWIWLQIQ